MVKYFILGAALFIILLILNESYEKSDAPDTTTFSASRKLQAAPLPDPATPVLVASDTNTDSDINASHTIEPSSIPADILAEFRRLKQISDEEVLIFLLKLEYEIEDITSLILKLIEEGILTVNIPLGAGPGTGTPLNLAMVMDPDMSPEEMQKFIDMGSYQTIKYTGISLVQLHNPETAAMIMEHLGYGPEHNESVTLGAVYFGNRPLFDHMTDNAPNLLTNADLQMKIENTLNSMEETTQRIEKIKKNRNVQGSITEPRLKKYITSLVTHQIARRQMLLEMQTLSFEQRQRINDEIDAFRQASEDRFSTLL